MSQTQPTIIVIGAARSGTHLLATMLTKRIDCAYANEVNDIWRDVPNAPRHDALPPTLATDPVCKKIRDRLDRVRAVSKSGVLMEKTAGNCLRMPFVYRVYPDAYYIHIIRDGRDIACSAAKKYCGDRRKMTTGASRDTDRTSRRAGRLLTLIRHKLASGLSVRQLLRNPGRYLNGALGVLGIRKQTIWGPRFPGMAEAFRTHTPVEVGGLQWRHSVEAIDAFLRETAPARYIEIRYEELVREPDRVLEVVLAFLSDQIPSHAGDATSAIIPPARTWRDTLNDEQVAALDAVIGDPLTRWGYR